MKRISSLFTVSALLLFTMAMFTPAWANHMVVENVSLTEQNAADNYTNIKFDVSWENSWRVSEISGDGTPTWDAAWVFAKWKLHSGSTWAHCTLSSTDAHHTAPTGSTIDAASDGTGIFIYRSGDDSGSNNWDNARLRWNYGTDGVADDAKVDVKVFAIEMVYIPEGSFALYNGESADLTANFNSANTIISENALAEGAITWDRTEINWCGAQDNKGNTGGCAALGANYPKGYKAIYCMKYEISQGQYADFLSLLTDDQDNNRYPNSNGSYRHTISGSYGSYSASVPNRACNYLKWADGLAYADWAGLRPMTELEYEKICRGPETAGIEYAWGNANIASSAYTLSNDGHYNATVSNAATGSTGNASYSITDGDINGPLRCGIFATGTSTRAESGASYYGVMEMSGNLWERCITVAMYCYDNTDWDNATGAGSFDGQHGNGSLSTTGFADVSNWPSQTATSGYTAYGSSFHGGDWHNYTTRLRVSDRSDAANPNAARHLNYGFRLSRTITP
ncbi:MAG: SUMF1/EgtB/PvdO family nonheme iron enzyme [Candidatus Marinimicrobia bacterium]|nr:SUMF1/EgtB/PvdO family nonheme iron enzyme [Candidatus Neomarinimicrobiota bacterium]